MQRPARYQAMLQVFSLLSIATSLGNEGLGMAGDDFAESVLCPSVCLSTGADAGVLEMISGNVS